MERENTAIRLNKLMRERNLRQVDILDMVKPYSEKYGVKLNKSDLSQFVSGKVSPGQEKLTILSLELGVTETWLMGLNTQMERNVLTFDTRVDDTPYNRALQKLQNKEVLTGEETIALKEELPKAINNTLKSFEKFSIIIDDANKNRLLAYYDALNSEGKAKLLERAEELTYIPKYQSQEEMAEAAHERTDIEVTDEMRKYDDDLMRNDDIWDK